MTRPQLPDGLEYVRTTDVFDNDTVPPGLLRAHHVADKVWGRFVVRSGSATFVFEDDNDRIPVTPDDGGVPIPPGRKHHVELDGPATFAVEFYRIPAAPVPTEGTESTAFQGGD